MRLDNVTVQSGNGASLGVPSVCVSEGTSAEPARVTQPAPVALIPESGGSRPQSVEAARPKRRERRELQDFLSAFV